MTELREQLLSARDAYRGIRYPGDLSADVLPAPAGRPRPTPFSVRSVLVRVAAMSLAAAAVISVIVIRPPRQAEPEMAQSTDPDRQQPRPSVRVAHQGGSHVWRFPPDLSFASEAAERVKLVAARVQVRVTHPYRDLRMPSIPELPSIPWRDWTRGHDKADAPDAPDTPASPGPSTRQSA